MVFVTSDWHGYPLEKIKGLLQKANFSDDDVCYVLGDVIDRGSESVELLEWMMAQPNIRLIKGNHEEMMLDNRVVFDTLLEKETRGVTVEAMMELDNWILNGGRPTIQGLAKRDKDTVARIVDYVRSAKLYERINVGGRDFLLVHSGLGNFDKSRMIEDYSQTELLWARPSIEQEYYDDVITVFGHTPTVRYGAQHKGRMVVTPTWINIDTGAAMGWGAPMLLRLDDMQPFYAKEPTDE